MIVPIDPDPAVQNGGSPRSSALGEHRAFAAMYERILERHPPRAPLSAPTVQVRPPRRALDSSAPFAPATAEGSRSGAGETLDSVTGTHAKAVDIPGSSCVERDQSCIEADVH